VIISNFKELSKEEYDKLTDDEKKRYLLNKLLMMNVVEIKDKKTK